MEKIRTSDANKITTREKALFFLPPQNNPLVCIRCFKHLETIHPVKQLYTMYNYSKINLIERPNHQNIIDTNQTKNHLCTKSRYFQKGKNNNYGYQIETKETEYIAVERLIINPLFI